MSQFYSVYQFFSILLLPASLSPFIVLSHFYFLSLLFLLKMGNSGALYLFIFVFAIQFLLHLRVLPMTGFELMISGFGSDSSTNCATTTVSVFSFYLYLFRCGLLTFSESVLHPIMIIINFVLSLSLPLSLSISLSLYPNIPNVNLALPISLSLSLSASNEITKSI